MGDFWASMRAAKQSSALSDVSYYFADLLARMDKTASESVLLAGALAVEQALSGEIRLDLKRFYGQAVFGERVDLVAPSEEIWQRDLSESHLVGDGSKTTILVRSKESVYLYRYFYLEKRFAGLLADRTHRQAGIVSPAPSDSVLIEAFGDDQDTQEQRGAVRMAFDHRISIISGGPGTGKTATVRRLLPLMWQHAGLSPERTLLCAPTGKAAARLRATLLERSDDPLFSGFSAEAVTIHRLLGWQPGGNFRYGATRRLPCDLLVIDEASMVDLALMVSLFEALPDESRVILLGDRDQLASVEAGAVLGDMSSAAESGIWPGGLVELKHNWRFGSESPIALLASAVRMGDARRAIDVLAASDQGPVSLLEIADDQSFDARIDEHIYPFFESITEALRAGEGLEKQFARLEQVMVICAHRHGSRGVEAVNTRIVERLGHSSRSSIGPAFPGMPVMLTRNSPGLGLFNGDIGIVVEGEKSSGLQAAFPGSDGRVVRFSLSRLPDYQPAYALTTHKAQGSQAKHVFLILPEKESRVLSRELIYTGITRARESVQIWGRSEILLCAIGKSAVRPTGLLERLQCR